MVASKHGKGNRELSDVTNWKLMDEIAPNRWLTKTLLDAANEWMEFKEKCRIQWAIESGAGNVIDLPQKTAGASNIVLPGKKIILPTSTGIIS